MFAINRRKLLTSSLGAVVLSWLPASMAVALVGKRTAIRSEIEEVLRGAFRDLDAAREVGRRVLSIYPVEADPKPLMDALEVESDPMRVSAALLRRRRAEFGSGETLLVDGWVLARSEAQLCALIAREVRLEVAEAREASGEGAQA